MYLSGPLFSLLLVVLSVGTAGAQVLPIPRGPDPKEIRREFNHEALQGVNMALMEWRDAWVRNDARAVARHYTEDALLLIGDGKPVQGRPAIERSFGGTLATTGAIQVGVDDFTASGSLAYAFGRFWYLSEEGEGEQTVTGSYVMVFRREGRHWRIRSQMFSADPAQRPTAAGG